MHSLPPDFQDLPSGLAILRWAEDALDSQPGDISPEVWHRYLDATANPEFPDICHYSLVLPLLYISADAPHWEALKPWFAPLEPTQLDVLADFCLLEMERPEAALAISSCSSLLFKAPIPPTACTAKKARTIIIPILSAN